MIIFSDQSTNYLKKVENSIESGLQFVHQSGMTSKYPSTVVAVYTQKEGLAFTNMMRIIDVHSKSDRKSSFNNSDGSDGDDFVEIS